MADFESDRQSEARRAYGDPERSIAVHGKKMETFNVDIRKNGAMKNRAFVLASTLGLLSGTAALGILGGSAATLRMLSQAPAASGGASNGARALLAVVAGASGVAFVIATSLGLERSVYDLELRRELWEIENHPTGELNEMVSIYKEQGLNAEDALTVTRIFAENKRMFANLMMVEELGYSRLEPPCTREAVANAAVPSFLGYALGAALPLLPAAALARGNASPARDDVCRLASGAIVGASALAISVVQTEVFFGAYTHSSTVLKAAVSTCAAVGTVFAVCYGFARLP